MEWDKIPLRFQRLMHIAREYDRTYFEKNPEAESYIRPYLPGENYPMDSLSRANGEEVEPCDFLIVYRDNTREALDRKKKPEDF
ncbi:MAG: hypothetical protein HXX08_25050 [Chloroflexi bacterium]|uniref:Uncharacterized protein n=1 Tax=Candidatus Chlorohelix allophototropha TaxID=3003348 RepID=A0A8T7MAI3_9CHLR|nr:hypothetical protein [Chloroflexota bacterium]WJW70448.1 hypothetical protein OZ401_005084 [Chloroflexota bacterium L227-S17]